MRCSIANGPRGTYVPVPILLEENTGPDESIDVLPYIENTGLYRDPFLRATTIVRVLR